MEAAASAANPKYAPCGSPARKRATRSKPKLGLSAVSRLPSANTAMSAISMTRRPNTAKAVAMTGAPHDDAKRVGADRQPRCRDRHVHRPGDVRSSRPMDANSPVPSANPPMASVSSAMPAPNGGRAAGACASSAEELGEANQKIPLCQSRCSRVSSASNICADPNGLRNRASEAESRPTRANAFWPAGHEDYGAVWVAFVEAAGHIDPVGRSRHLDVRQQRVEPVNRLHQCAGFVAVDRFDYNVTCVLQSFSQSQSDESLILHEKDAIIHVQAYLTFRLWRSHPTVLER